MAAIEIKFPLVLTPDKCGSLAAYPITDVVIHFTIIYQRPVKAIFAIIIGGIPLAVFHIGTSRYQVINRQRTQ
ncbi:hypothetical protein ES703_53970 [subsurface metagenome]